MSNTHTPIDERTLRFVVPLITAAYTPSYHFDNAGGLFIERILKNIYKGREDYLKSAIYVSLLGGSDKEDGLSIPCKVRVEITDKIVQSYHVALKNYSKP